MKDRRSQKAMENRMKAPRKGRELLIKEPYKTTSGDTRGEMAPHSRKRRHT